MYEYNCVNASSINKRCNSCLKIGDDVRIMTRDEQNLYLKFVQMISNEVISLSICLLCAHLLKKLGKFLFQCQEAYNILNNPLIEVSKRHFYLSHLTVHRLIVTEPQITEFQNDSYDFATDLLSLDDAFDDEDVPLVLLKNEECHDVEDKVKKKKKSKKKHKGDETSMSIEDSKPRCNKTKKVPKKDLPIGFSSRMVQETEEYLVIKLTTEQVIQEMQDRSKREEYTRTLFKCDKCVKGFNFEDVLRTHMEKHSPKNGPYQCEICTQYCPSVVSLRGHMKSHTTRYKCKVCGRVRQSRQHLLEHHASHAHAAPAYTCRRCAFTTTKRTSMQRHVKSHRAGEKHACHQCGKLFKSEETLRVHTMRHDKSKRLQCEECNRMFIYPSLLHRHVQAVHVRKDYYCVECDMEFKSRENLRRHFIKAKRHRDVSSYQYECPECPERFVSPSALSAHAQNKKRACAAWRRGDARGKHRKSLDTTPEPDACALVDKLNNVHDKKHEDSILTEVSQPALLES